MPARAVATLRKKELFVPTWFQKASLLVALATLACTDPSAPGAISAHFILTDVDGHQLPAVSPPSVGTPGQTIVSATLSLDQAGGAVLSEDRKDSGGAFFTNALSYKYTIKGTTITFVPATPCPIDVICAAPPTGEILDNGLRVQVVFPPGYVFQVYNFRASATP